MGYVQILERFKREVANIDELPRDLELLVWATATEAGTPFDELGLFAILPGEKEALLEEFIFGASHLSQEEANNPDIGANIAAIAEVASMITFVAKDEEDNFYGYWHGKENCPLEHAPIVQFDNEGQFYMMPGPSLVEALTAAYCFEDQDLFEKIKEGFAELEFEFVHDTWQDVYDSEAKLQDDPSKFHHELYNAERAKRGLPSID